MDGHHKNVAMEEEKGASNAGFTPGKVSAKGNMGENPSRALKIGVWRWQPCVPVVPELWNHALGMGQL